MPIIITMPKRITLFILIAATALFAVDCSARQLRSDMEIDEAARRAAADEERGWQSLETTVRTNDADTDVEMQKKALAAVGKIKSPRAETLLRENLSSRYLRGEAAAGLNRQRDANNKDQIDALLVAAATKNAEEFSGLTREEIAALGDVDNPAAVRLLKEQIGRDPNKDELTIDALGKILKRRQQTYHPLNFSLPLGQSPSAGASLQIESIMSSDDKREGDSASDKSPTSAADSDPEQVLLNFLAGDGSVDAKDRAAQNIANAHPPGVTYLLQLAAKRRVPTSARIAIVDYLTRYAVNQQDKSMIGNFYALRRSANSAQLLSSIDLSLRVLGNAFGQAIATGRVRRYSAAPVEPYATLPKEADIVTLKQKPYPGYSAADVRTNLKKALVYYRLDAKIAERMQRRVNDLLNLPENKQAPERSLIFAALSRLYPQKDFYVLKEQGQNAFSKPGYFTTTLRLITSSKRDRSWQIAALQRLWNLSYQEADWIRQIYLRDGKLLQQRMRL